MSVNYILCLCSLLFSSSTSFPSSPLLPFRYVLSNTLFFILSSRYSSLTVERKHIVQNFVHMWNFYYLNYRLRLEIRLEERLFVFIRVLRDFWWAKIVHLIGSYWIAFSSISRSSLSVHLILFYRKVEVFHFFGGWYVAVEKKAQTATIRRVIIYPNARWFSKINKVQPQQRERERENMYFTFFVHSGINHRE